MSTGRWVDVDCPRCGIDYDIMDPSDEQWARPTCPACGAECEVFNRCTPQEDGTLLYG